MSNTRNVSRMIFDTTFGKFKKLPCFFILYIMNDMKDRAKIIAKNKQFSVFVEKDEDGFYVVECPLFRGCYSQGKTLDEALSTGVQHPQVFIL